MPRRRKVFAIRIVDNDLGIRGFGNVAFRVDDIAMFYLDANALGNGRFELVHGSTGRSPASGVNTTPGVFTGKFRPLRAESITLTAGEVKRIMLTAYKAAREEKQSTVA